MSFNDILFNSKCRETSPTHDPSIDSNIIVQELFKENEDWVDRETLYQAVKSVGKVLDNNTYNATDLASTNQKETTPKVLCLLVVHSVLL